MKHAILWGLALLGSSLLAPAAAAAQVGEPPFPAGELEQECPEPATVEPWEGFSELRLIALAGLIQPIALRGGNVEVDLMYRRLVVGYSHGFLLHMQGNAVVGEAAKQGLSFFLPYSTGMSAGYRFLEWFDVRLEAKVHRFEVSEESSSASLFAYTTFTLGIGAYAQYRPFRDFGVGAKTQEWLHGFVLMGSARYWPNVWTSLDDNRRTYANPSTGRDEIHSAANIGIANTPFVVNLSVGYSVQF